MSADKLKNLMLHFRTKLEQMDKLVLRLPATDQTEDVRASIRDLDANVALFVSRPDTLTSSDAEAVRDHVIELRKLASSPPLRIRVRFGVHDKSASEILDEIFLVLLNLTAGVQIGLGQISPEDVSGLIPPQKIATYQFEFRDGRLTVIDQPASAGPMAEAVRDVLIEQGARILRQLERSNCSPRLFESVEVVQEKLLKNANIVQIGVLNSSFSNVLAAAADEVGDSLRELMSSHIGSIYAYLAQFEDWRTFIQHAAEASLDKTDVEALISTARSLATHFEENLSSADPAVPYALRHVADIVERSEKPDGRLLLALARTLENIWSVTSRAFLSLLKETGKELAKRTAQGIVLVVVGGCVYFGAAAEKIPGGEWVKNTINYIRSLTPTAPGPK